MGFPPHFCLLYIVLPYLTIFLSEKDRDQLKLQNSKGSEIKNKGFLKLFLLPHVILCVFL